MNKSLTVILVIMSCHVQAGDQAQDSDLPQWTVDRITPLHDRVSRWVSNTSRNIDGFFGTDDHLHTSNKSYIRLSQEFQWEEGEDFSTDPGIRFKLDLPTTKERLRLIIESDPEETRGTLAEQGSQRLRNDNQSSSDTVIGLSRLSDKDWTQNWDTRFSAGVKFRLPLDPYLRWDAERLWSIGDGPWKLASENRLSWFNSDGYFVRTRWDLGRPLDAARHLRFVTNVQWQEDEDTLEFSEMAAIDQVLGRRSAIRYAAVMVGNSGSSPRINDYYLQTLYRRNLHREILYADVIPELHFHRDTDFDPRWGITLRLEMFFRGDVVKR
ncbi:MAG: hypothetical protein WC953_08995 [Pseudomonas sp.]